MAERIRAPRVALAFAVGAALVAGAGAAEQAGPPAASGLVALGTPEAALRERFAGALREEKVERLRSLQERILDGAGTPPGEAAAEAFAGQKRLVRELDGGDVARAEYDLFRGRVYRTRWRLAERFERPLMPPLVAHLSERFGEPAYDQTLEGRIGSPRAELRRVGWRREGRALELRQLHPMTGGPLYLTLSDPAAMQAIVEARALVMPQPERRESGVDELGRPPVLLSSKERESLLAGVDALLAQIGF